MTEFLFPFYASPRSVASVLVEGPTVEPLTLDEAKLAAGLDWPPGDPRDTQMEAFIAAARSKVEQDTGLALLQQTRDIFVEVFWAGGVIPLPWQALPLQSITDPLGRVLTRDEVLIDRQLGTLALPPAASGYTIGTFRIVSGWPDAASLKKEAPLLWQAVALLTAHYATLGRDVAIAGTIVTDVPQTYDDAVAPFRLMWVI